MPNIIVELQQEISRVTALLPKFDIPTHQDAVNTIRYAREGMNMNNFEAMSEAIDDLKKFGKKPEEPNP